MSTDMDTIPARGGKAVRLDQGQEIKVVNTHGEQVVDTWAFNAHDLSEYMSMQATRAYLLKLVPEAGDALVTNRRREILTVLEDSCGVHDTLMAACDNERYGLLGCTEYHANCA
ncbi:MAG: urea carboxylase-associated family protein, partial [Alphaproteobacteria bacterium]|nr:urea carboxylase-associated family protein [Alphaproteobacteria bacterium]